MHKSQQAVIFDLGGVLLREAEFNLHKAQSPNLRIVLGNELPRAKIFNRAFQFASLFYGPNCLSEWCIGNLTGQEIVEKIKENIDNTKFDAFFRDQYERDLIKYGIEFIIVPNLLADLTDIFDDGIEFVKKCKANGIKTAVISNWDPYSFEILKTKIPEVFNLFDERDIVIPQMLGKSKPTFEIYDFTIKRINIDLAHCYFVDDSQMNVEGAQKYGIKSVQHKNWQETERELMYHGLKLEKSTTTNFM